MGITVRIPNIHVRDYQVLTHTLEPHKLPWQVSNGVWIAIDKRKWTIRQWHGTIFCLCGMNLAVYWVYFHCDSSRYSTEDLYLGSSHRQYSISCSQPVGYSDVICNVLTTGWCRIIWPVPCCYDSSCAALFNLFRLCDFVSWEMCYQHSDTETKWQLVFQMHTLRLRVIFHFVWKFAEIHFK